MKLSVSKKLVVSVMCSLCVLSHAQVPDEGDRTLDGLANEQYVDKLIDLAMEYNNVAKAMEVEKRLAKNNVNLARLSWLDHFNISGNLNEFNINPLSLETDGYRSNLYYPRYNFNVTINIGAAVRRTGNINAAKYGAMIKNYEIEEFRVKLRTEVLKRYKAFLVCKQLLALRDETYREAYEHYEKKSADFTDGTVTMDELNMAKKNYDEVVELKLDAEKNLYMTKIDLEELIGRELNTIQ